MLFRSGSDTSTVHSNRSRGLEGGRGQVCWVGRGLKLRQKQVRSGLYLKLDMGLVAAWAKGRGKRRAAPVQWPVAGRQPWGGGGSRRLSCPIGCDTGLRQPAGVPHPRGVRRPIREPVSRAGWPSGTGGWFWGTLAPSLSPFNGLVVTAEMQPR